MQEVTDSEAVLLGLLCEKPMHGYEIEKTIESRNMRYWTEVSFYSIYRLLKKMEAKKLIESRVAPSKSLVARKTYAATSRGREAMKRKVLESLSAVESTIWRVDIAIGNLGLLSSDEAAECLGKYVASIDEAIGRYKALKAYFHERHYPESDFALAARPIMHLRTEKAWALQFLKKVKTGETA